MSVESKYAYRFGFLKSAFWENLRLEKFIQDGMDCCICGTEDFSNDAHHIHYRRRWRDTKLNDLAVLCRTCHKRIHEIILAKGLSEEQAFAAFKIAHRSISVERRISSPEELAYLWNATEIIRPDLRLKQIDLMTRLFRLAKAIQRKHSVSLVVPLRKRMEMAGNEGKESARAALRVLRKKPLVRLGDWGQKMEVLPIRKREPIFESEPRYKAAKSKLFGVAKLLQDKFGIRFRRALRICIEGNSADISEACREALSRNVILDKPLSLK